MMILDFISELVKTHLWMRMILIAIVIYPIVKNDINVIVEKVRWNRMTSDEKVDYLYARRHEAERA